MLESKTLQRERVTLQNQINSPRLVEMRQSDDDYEARTGERQDLLHKLADVNERMIVALDEEQLEAQIAMSSHVPLDGMTPEQREFHALGQRTSLDEYVFAGASQRHLRAGTPEEEYNQHVFGKWNVGELPLEMFLDRDQSWKPHELEEMRAVITGVVGTAGMPTFVDRIFNASDGAYLGATYPAVGPGRHSYPVVSSRTAAADFARDAAETPAGGITVVTADPTRIQRSYEVAASDELQMPGIGAALVSHIRTALEAGMDNMTVDDIISTITTVDDNTIITLARVLGKFGGAVDGFAAKTVDEVRLLVATTAAMNATNTYGFASALSIANIGHFFNLMPHARFRGSPHFASGNGANNHQSAIAVRTGPGPATLIVPVWRRAELLRDTGRLQTSGQITLTGAMYADVILASQDRHQHLEMTLA